MERYNGAEVKNERAAAKPLRTRGEERAAKNGCDRNTEGTRMRLDVLKASEDEGEEEKVKDDGDGGALDALPTADGETGLAGDGLERRFVIKEIGKALTLEETA